ncbi:hypothetical protein DZK27_07510 [Rhodobacteraceae bacterium 63075]|nr:hypothetical protein DZK27_07510 [Rhodobacteraceae bacterium 63075]
MTAPMKYETTATGSIDYAHYDRRAREIRSQETWSLVGLIGRKLKAAGASLHRRASGKATPVSRAPTRDPMRSPQPRRAGKASERIASLTRSR